MAINRTATASIAAGASLSSAVYLGAGTLLGISLPSAWTAATVTLQTSLDGGATWIDVYDDGGNEIVLSPAAGKFTPLDAGTFGNLVYLKVRSGTGSAPVNQVGARSITLHNRVLGYAG